MSVQPKFRIHKEVVVRKDKDARKQNWWTENSKDGRLYVNKRTKYSCVLKDFDLNC